MKTKPVVTALFWQELGETTHPDHSFVLVHGLGGDSQSLPPLAQELLHHFPQAQLVLYDLRGHGSSPALHTSTAATLLETHARDLADICQTCRSQNLILVGHSLGGMIIQEYLQLKLAPRPHKTVFVCSTLSVAGSYALAKLSWKVLRALASRLPPPKQRTTATHVRFSQTHDFNLVRIFHDVVSVGLVQWLLMYGSVFGWKNQLYPELNTPNSLFIFGEKDQLVRTKTQIQIQKLVPKAQTALVTTNHLSVFQNPVEIGQVIAKFIQNP